MFSFEGIFFLLLRLMIQFTVMILLPLLMATTSKANFTFLIVCLLLHASMWNINDEETASQSYGGQDGSEIKKLKKVTF